MTEHEWSRLPARRIAELAAAGAVALLPVGALEQHGPHLPTGVDDQLCAEVCARTARRLQGRRNVVIAPPVPVGLSEHHMDFGGTLTVSLTTFHALLEDLCTSIARAGFSDVIIVNGHGGNMTALGAIVDDLADRLGIAIATATYFVGARGVIAETLDDQDQLMHACEGETSMMLAVAPELVEPSLFAEAHGPPIALLGDPVAIYRFTPLSGVTTSGVCGDARRATATKGERILDACADALATSIQTHPPVGGRPNRVTDHPSA